MALRIRKIPCTDANKSTLRYRTLLPNSWNDNTTLKHKQTSKPLEKTKLHLSSQTRLRIKNDYAFSLDFGYLSPNTFSDAQMEGWKLLCQKKMTVYFDHSFFFSFFLNRYWHEKHAKTPIFNLSLLLLIYDLLFLR
eukprot:TRINITY_DN6509_c0_g1_i7.p1 TRINITY_DN6509_c0_g1~~TRINITY_DN6509_c0_g1_i7.p1  ORF type:complete len:136 (+),score=12.64 TRINITY_DN6509_c0_g1_i7:342-749(+)